MSYPDPSQVLQGVTYGESDEMTGNVVLPSDGYVLSGTSFGPNGSSSGSYTPSGYPTTDAVLVGNNYGPNGSDYSGQITMPSDDQVVVGATFGNNNGSTGAGLDVAESPDVTVRDNTFELGLAGSKFAGVAIQLRDIARDVGSNRLQRLLVGNNAFLGTSITRDKASQKITLAKNTITVTSDNAFTDGGSNRVPS